jgi:hypothetical protein
MCSEKGHEDKPAREKQIAPPQSSAGASAVASTIVQIQRLPFPELMIDIKCVAQV